MILGQATAGSPLIQDVQALSLQQVCKTYGRTPALIGVDLIVRQGECVALLGANGAGKSTLMRVASGRVAPDSGAVHVCGQRVIPSCAPRRLGLVPQADNLDPELTVLHTLRLFARLHRVPRAHLDTAVDRGLAIAGLSDRAHARVDALSLGMRRRLLIARSMLHEPALLMLDEPTIGLDPLVRHRFWTLVENVREQGSTVVISTHYFDEAEQLADVVTVMARGAVVGEGRPRDLVRRHAGEEVVELCGPERELTPMRARLAAQGLRSCWRGSSLLALHAERSGTDTPRGQRRRATLEDAFLALTEAQS